MFGKGRHVHIGNADADAAFALRLATDLKARGKAAWINAFGKEPLRTLGRELEQERWQLDAWLYVLVLSPGAIESKPARQLLSVVPGLRERGIRTLLLLYQDCEIPTTLQGTRFVNFWGRVCPSVRTALGGIGGTSEEEVGRGNDEAPYSSRIPFASVLWNLRSLGGFLWPDYDAKSLRIELVRFSQAGRQFVCGEPGQIGKR